MYQHPIETNYLSLWGARQSRLPARIDPFLGHQFAHRFLQEAMSVPNAHVGLFFVRHIFLCVAYITKDKY